MQPIRCIPLVVAVAGALALSACTGDEADDGDATPTDTAPGSEEDAPAQPSDDGSEGASPSDDGSEGASPPDDGSEEAAPPSDDGAEPTPSSPASSEVPDLTNQCELQSPTGVAERSVTFAVPEGWQIEEGECRFLDPELARLEEGTEPDAALSVRISEVDFPTASQTEEIEGEIRWTGARSGYQSVRIRGGAAGQAIQPEGEPVQLLLVDLDAGTDEQGGTLVMSAAPSSGASFELAANALDRIARTLRIEPQAADIEPTVVTRVEGGGAPYAVTYDRDESCFRLHAGEPAGEVIDDACDVAIDGDQIAGAILEDGDRQIVAGLAPPTAVVVESDAATAPYGGITTPAEGASLFAYDAIMAPLEVRAIGATGEELATATIE